MPDIDYFDNVDMGSGLFMPFYFSYPYRFNYGFLKNFFYPFGFSRGYKTTVERSGKQFPQSGSYKTTAKAGGKPLSESAEGFNLSTFSAQAEPKFFTRGSTANFEKALDNANWKTQKSAYERYFTDIGKNFSQINKTSDIFSKNTDYQKSYLYSNIEAFERNLTENFVKDLYKVDLIKQIEAKKSGFSNWINQIKIFNSEFLKPAAIDNSKLLKPAAIDNSKLLKPIAISNSEFLKLTAIKNSAFLKHLEIGKTDFIKGKEAENLKLLTPLEIISPYFLNTGKRENPAFSKAYESVLSTVKFFEKSPKFGITSVFPKSEYVNIFPSFKTKNTPYKSTENFTAKAVENQSAIIENLSKQEQNFYLYGKENNTVFQSLENRAEKNLELVPLKFSPKSIGKSLGISEQKTFQNTFQNSFQNSFQNKYQNQFQNSFQNKFQNQFQNSLQKPCQATPEKSLTTAGIDLDSLLEMICSALEEELNTCAEGVHY